MAIFPELIPYISEGNLPRSLRPGQISMLLCSNIKRKKKTQNSHLSERKVTQFLRKLMQEIHAVGAEESLKASYNLCSVSYYKFC